MIKINKIVPFTCEAFDPDGNSLGMLNHYEFNDLRIQIKKNKVNGYYMKFNNQIITLNANGNCNLFPIGFYDLFQEQLFKLIK